MKRNSVRRRLDTIAPYEFEGDINSVIDTLNKLVETHGPDVRLDYSHDGFDMYSDSPGFLVYRDEPENDEELAERIKKESAERSARDARDAAEFARLSQKFRKTV